MWDEVLGHVRETEGDILKTLAIIKNTFRNLNNVLFDWDKGIRMIE